MGARLLGHWGSDAGQIFTYVHMNRLIKKYNLDVLFISGPGHGAPGIISQSYMEGVYSEVYPDKAEDEEGMRKFFKQFSFPGGIGSHATPETPGSIHEGGELGYSISHAFGAVFDHPELIALTMVGDGESETGPLATSWHSTKFLNPITDGSSPGAPSEWLQDQQPYSACSCQPHRARIAIYRLWLDSILRRRKRPYEHASSHGRHLGKMCHGYSRLPEEGA